MNILLTGGTGFVGSRLARELTSSGHQVTVVSRKPGHGATWDRDSLSAAVRASDAVVHLAGKNIFEGRWNAERREEIRASRVETTDRLARLCAEHGTKALVCASAVGIYGIDAQGELDEGGAHGSDFLASVCREWEAALAPATQAGVRTVQMRIGVVLGREDGAFKRMLLPFKLGLGGPLGSGRQPFPWIHVEDLVQLFLRAVEDTEWNGAYNAVAPEQVTMKEFAKALGRALHRPAFLPAPGFAIRLALGGVAEVLLSGQRAVPRRALAHGFEYRFGALDGALADLTKKGAA